MELLNILLTLPLPKLDIISARLGSNGLIFSGDISIDIQLVIIIIIIMQC